MEKFHSFCDNIDYYDVDYRYELPAEIPPVFYCKGNSKTVIRYNVLAEREDKRELSGLPYEFSGNNNWVALSDNEIMICGEMVNYTG